MVVRGEDLPRIRAGVCSEPGTSAPSLAAKLAVRAENALEKADRMLPGGERAAAIRNAKILANAAELLQHFSSTGGPQPK